MAAAVENMTAVGRKIKPDPKLAEIYDRKYKIYRKTLECLDGLWDQMQEMVENGE